MKPKFFVMVGVAGSGKSTYAKRLSKEENAVIHSSDAIREELNGSRQILDNDKEVFKIFKERILEDLTNNKNVICDMTNISVKRRASWLNLVKNVDCERIAVYIDKDLETCLKQNKERPSEHFVPEYVVGNMKKWITTPTTEEGFDKIIVIKK